MEMLSASLAAHVGGAIGGRLEGGVLYTDAYLARVKAQLRGALRGAAAPVSLPALRRDLGLEGLGALGALLPALTEELQREGAVDGRAAPGGQSWVPAAHVRAQLGAARAAYAHNGHVALAAAAKHGVGGGAAALAAAFGEGSVLGSTYVSPGLVSQAEAAVEEALQGGGWCDVQAALPPSLPPADAAALLQACPAARAPGARVLAGTCAVAAAFVDALQATVVDEARAAAGEAHTKKQAAALAAAAAKGAPPPAAGGKKGKPAAPAAPPAADDDDDWDGGKGGKGGKKGKGGARKGKGMPSGGGKGGKGAGDAPSGAASAAAAAAGLSLSALTDRVLQLHPDLEGAGAEGELAAALAGELRPAAVAEYERALRDIFTAGADRRRRLRDAAGARLDECALRLQLHAKGAELFAGDEATGAVLRRHLVRAGGADCVDALLHFLEADRADEEAEAGGEAGAAPAELVVASPIPPAQRARIAAALPPDARLAVAAAVEALAAAAAPAPAEFLAALEAAAEAAGLRLRRLDKKSEPGALAAAGAALAAQAAAAGGDPVALLAVAVPLLLVRRRGRCVSLPGRALGAGVEALRGELEAPQHALLAEFHAAVVGRLKEGGGGGGGGGAAAAGLDERLAALAPRVQELLAG
jgi:hypothetical protein